MGGRHCHNHCNFSALQLTDVDIDFTAGGWLFYGLYAGCQLWWFLAVCLAVWAFGLVAVSFLLTGNQYLSPVALITAFIGEPGACQLGQTWSCMSHCAGGLRGLVMLCKAVALASEHVVHCTRDGWCVHPADGAETPLNL